MPVVDLDRARHGILSATVIPFSLGGCGLCLRSCQESASQLLALPLRHRVHPRPIASPEGELGGSLSTDDSRRTPVAAIGMSRCGPGLLCMPRLYGSK